LFLFSARRRRKREREREEEKTNDRTRVRGRRYEMNARPRHILHRSKSVWMEEKRKADKAERKKKT